MAPQSPRLPSLGGPWPALVGARPLRRPDRAHATARPRLGCRPDRARAPDAEARRPGPDARPLTPLAVVPPTEAVAPRTPARSEAIAQSVEVGRGRRPVRIADVGRDAGEKRVESPRRLVARRRLRDRVGIEALGRQARDDRRFRPAAYSLAATDLR